VTSDRWSEIEKIYHTARERDASARASFLDEACGADAALRREVETLLYQDAKSGSFLDQPAMDGALVKDPIGDAASQPISGSSLRQMLASGSRLGPYEILSLAGVGGMGQVYRATDIRLDRTVAIKVVSPEWILHSGTRERFQREARALSRLSHPNICTLHDVGEQDGIDYFAMEYLEGETLKSRLERGLLPQKEALRAAIAIAYALDKAHRAGITHRDLKPGNIMLTASGPKLLDFGLARSEDDGHSSLTQSGAFVGTPQYMAPEQRNGRKTDARTDVFSFGTVVCEMVAGSCTLVNQPEIKPAALDHLVRKCLAEDPEDRWQSMHDVASELEWIAESSSDAGVIAHVAVTQRKRDRLAWIAAECIGVLALTMTVLAARYFLRPSDTQQVRFEVQTPPMPNYPVQIALSPDGRKLAFVASAPDEKQMLFVRAMDSLTQQILSGTENAKFPFWSPDSQYIGFADPSWTRLQKININGGRPQTICEPCADGGFSRGTWNSDGIILFGWAGGVYRVPASGGVPTRVTTLDKERQEFAHGTPYFLPDGRRFLFTTHSNKVENQFICVGSLDSPLVTRLIAADSDAVYAPPGFLLFQRGGSLFAQPFDDKRLTLSGEPVSLAPSVAHETNGMGAYAASSNGTLVYRAGNDVELPLTWVSRDGKSLGIAAAPGQYRSPAISPSGKLLAFAKTEGSNTDLWILDLMRDTSTRFTSDPGLDSTPIWSPDGSQLAFESYREKHYDLYVKDAGGLTSEELLLKSDRDKFNSDWSPNRRYLLYIESVPMSGNDLWILPLDGDRKPFAFIQTPLPASELHGRFSPDGHWVAFSSNETQRREVYVQGFPSGIKQRISTGGGWEPKWRADGKELFYLTYDRTALMAVDVKGAENRRAFEVGAPHELFQASFSIWPYGYDVTPDGQRFIINGVPHGSASAPVSITVVLNWTAGLKK
jgi:Tol biopolymer transport system component/predicted Ser/Thr protein kinase